MVRVLAVLHLPDAAGPAQHVQPWLAALAEGVSLEVVAPERGSALALYEDFADTQTLAYRALTFPQSLRGSVKDAWRFLREIGVFARHLRSRRPDLVFVVTTSIPGPLYASSRAGIPTVVYAAELFARQPRDDWLRPRARGAIRHLVARKATAIVCCSNAVRDQFSAPLVRTIYPGIDPARPPGDGPRFRREHGIPANALCVGVAGNITEGRGQDVAIEALSLLAEGHPDAHLVLAGVPHDRSADLAYMAGLRALASRLGVDRRVIFGGFLAPLDDFYAAMDVVVNPARAPEAFGRVAIEALAAGTPVVSTKVGAVSEVLQNGEQALLVTPDSAAELAAAIERVVSEEGLADRLARQGGAAIAERFSLERSIGAFLGVVREVLPDGLS